MVFYSDFIYYSGTNDPVVNAAVTVMIANTQTPAALFTSGIGNVIKPNPVTSDQNGFFSFYVAQGTYDLYFLGVKQYQISVNGTTGIPDPLTIGTVNCNMINSKGITLATPNPTAPKNDIDFYEFGTWTPVGVNAAVIAAGFAGNDPIVCNYQRIGKRVTIGISINVTGGGTSGPFSLGGLPFPVNSLIAPVVALCVGGNGGSYLWVANSGGATELHISPTNNIFSSLTGIQAEVEQFFFGTITYLTD